MAVEVSIIIPTFNRRDRLVRCLEFIAEQSYPRSRTEVIVVSDGSTDGTVEAAREAGERLGLELRVIDAEHGGPGSARNHGGRAARGDIIAFTDDDVEVTPGWIEAAMSHFADETVGGVEGKTDPVLGATSIYRVNLSNQEGGIYPTCNMFYRRRLFESIGGFDEHFWRVREDSDFAFRVLDTGSRIVFEPGALVGHRSHHSSPRMPFVLARTMLDTIYLSMKHGDRSGLRPGLYRSDVAKIVLGLAAVFLAGTGRPALALLAGIPFCLLVLRTMARELLPSRLLRPDRLIAVSTIYALSPFAHAYYLMLGRYREFRGRCPPDNQPFVGLASAKPTS